MRNNIMLFSLVAIVAACADQQQQPTSPSVADVGGRAAPSAATEVSSNAPTVGGQAKPTDQVGFTQLFDMDGPPTLITAVIQTLTVVCPAGSKAVSGGYSMLVDGSDKVNILALHRFDTGFEVVVHLTDPTATPYVIPRVTCIK
jgi:hypothetical protein